MYSLFLNYLVLEQKTAQELYDVEQGKNLEEYAGTATSLAKKFIVKHADKDIRLYAAYCIAQVLRIFAPDPPYEKSQLWVSIVNIDYCDNIRYFITETVAFLV